MGGSSKGNSPTQKADNLFNQDIVELGLGIAEGTIRGLTNGLKSFYVDDIPLESESGELNYQDIGISFRQGYMDDQPLRYFMGGESSLLNNASNVSLPAEVTRSFITPTTVRGSLSFIDLRLLVQKLYSGDSGGNIYESSIILEIKYRKVGESTWRYVLRGTENISKLRDAANSVRLKLAEQGINYDDLTPEEKLDYNLTYTETIKSLTDRELEAYKKAEIEYYKKLALRVSSYSGFGFLSMGNLGLSQISNPHPKKTSYLDQNPEATLEKLDSEWFILEGKTTGGYISEICIPIFDAEDDTHDWEIQITRKSKDLTSEQQKYSAKEIMVESIALTTRQEVKYPKTAICHIVAQHTDRFNQIPNFSAEIDGFMCLVPSNYNADEKTFVGVWDGSFKRAWTNNNALILHELIVNEDWGKRSVEPLLTVDHASLLEAIKWCDEKIEDLNGEFKARHTFNMVLSNVQNLDDVILLVAGSFHAVVKEYFGVLSFHIDKPKQPSFFVTTETVLQTGFQYSLTDLQTQYNEIKVSFLNAENQYTQETRRIIDEDSILKNGYISYSFEAVGVTNVSEALRQAAYLLLTNRDEKVLATFSQPRLGHVVAPYEWFYLADRKNGWANSGRIEKFNSETQTIYLRDSILPANEYVIYWHTPFGITSAKAKCTNGLDLILFGELNNLQYLKPEVPLIISGGIYGEPKTFRLLSYTQSDSNDVAQGELFNFKASIVSEDKYTKHLNLKNMEGLTLEKEILKYKRPELPTRPTLKHFLLKNTLNSQGQLVYSVSLTADVLASKYLIKWVNEDTQESFTGTILGSEGELSPAFSPDVPLMILIYPLDSNGIALESRTYRYFRVSSQYTTLMPKIQSIQQVGNSVIFTWGDDDPNIFPYSEVYVDYKNPSGSTFDVKINKGQKTFSVPYVGLGSYSLRLFYSISIEEGQGFSGVIPSQNWSYEFDSQSSFDRLLPPNNLRLTMLDSYVLVNSNNPSAGLQDWAWIKPPEGYLILDRLILDLPDRVNPNIPEVSANPEPFELQYSSNEDLDNPEWIVLDYYSESRNLTTSVIFAPANELQATLSKNLKSPEFFPFKKLGWLRLRSKYLAGGRPSSKDSNWVYIQIPNTGITASTFNPLNDYYQASGGA